MGCPHYLDLAVWGYMAGDPGWHPTYGQTGDMDLMIVFYPLFPAAIAALMSFLPDLVAPIAVSTVASVAVVVLLYRVVARDLGPDHREAGGGLHAHLPDGVLPPHRLHRVPVPGPGPGLVPGGARTGRWWVAGLLGGLAALTRVNGLVLIPSLVVEAWAAWRIDPSGRAGVGLDRLVGVGFGGYLLLNLAVYGDPFAFIQIQNEHWFKSLTWPWVGIGGVDRPLDADNLEDVVVLGVVELVAIGLGLAGTVIALFRFRPSWAVWMAGNWLLFVSTAFVLSVPRYDLAMFPLFAWFALMAERRWLGVGHRSGVGDPPALVLGPVRHRGVGVLMPTFCGQRPTMVCAMLAVGMVACRIAIGFR